MCYCGLNIKHTIGLGDVSALSHIGLRTSDVKTGISAWTGNQNASNITDWGCGQKCSMLKGFKSSAAAVKVNNRHTCKFTLVHFFNYFYLQ